MGFVIGGGSGKGGNGLSVRKSHIFADNSTRDSYFATNPSELITDVYVSSAGELYQWDSSQWVLMSAIIKGVDGSNGANGNDGSNGVNGQDGAPAPYLRVQYSNDGFNGWGTAQQAGSKYWRWSNDNGSSWSTPVLFKADDSGGTGLPDPFYYQKNLQGELTIRAVFNGVDQEILQFGSIESDELKFNKALGGLRYVHPNGTEYFAVRASATGDGKSMVFGNYDTTGPNYLTTSETGFVESILTTIPSDKTVTYTASTNVLGGHRLVIDYTADEDVSISTLTLSSAVAGTTKFNTYITNVAGDVLFSNHQNKEEYDSGFGDAKFTKTLVGGVNVHSLSQPFPLLKGTTVRITYDFDIDLGFVGAASIQGFKLRLGRVLSSSTLTQADIAALPSSEKYNGRIVYQSDAQKGYYVYQDGAWTQLGKPATATDVTTGIISSGAGLTTDINGRMDIDVGTGLKLSDNSTTAKVMVDAANLDVTTLKNADTLVSGVYQGALDGVSTLANLANASKGAWWNVAATVTLETTTFYTGDQLWCRAAVVGVPTTLASFVRVPASSATATSTVYGVVKKASNVPLKSEYLASKGTSDAMASEDHSHPQNDWAILNWQLSRAYNPSDIVMKEGLLYTIDATIPANTPFAIFDGTGSPIGKWKPFYWPVKHEGTIGGNGRFGIDNTGIFWESI